MNHKYLDKIEYGKILEILSGFAVTHMGKEIANMLTPYSTLDKALSAMKETSECDVLLYRIGTPPISDIADITLHTKSLKSQGSLSAPNLLELANIFKMTRELKDYFTSIIDTSFCERINEYFDNLYSNKRIEDSVFTKITDEDTIDDHASTTLWHIRKDIQKTESEIRQKLNSYLRANYIREPVITIRAGRFVIPVKQEKRNEINGFVHDISSSGSTVFIEPTTVFEMNNKLNSLRLEENNEIEKILHELTSLFYPYIEELKQNSELIGKIDFAFAKAKYARSIDANEPNFNEKEIMNLINARHPLIEPDKVVPISVPLGKDFNCLIITGPNTGGKTVTLKTVGLLCAMASSGLYIPADTNSTVCVFDNIYADIGDEQSIQESLSTFSSHMTNIIEILHKATKNSLVLLDELGSGTDPAQGSSLAISILDSFYQKGCLTLSTTHYPEVKNYALVTDGFENASSEFDVESLKPTYKLLIGVPGQSNAFAISKKLGLDEPILNKAEALISDSSISVEEILKNIYDDKKKAEEEKEKAIKHSQEIEELKIILEKQKAELDLSMDESIVKAKEKAKQILIDAKQEADEIIKELENTTSKSDANRLRKNLKERINEFNIEESPNASTPLDINEIHIGDFVRIRSINNDGVVLKLPDKSR